MKANNGSGNNESRDIWKTPKVFFRILNRQYDFTFDCCARFEDTKCDDYSDEFEDIDWGTEAYDRIKKKYVRQGK